MQTRIPLFQIGTLDTKHSILFFPLSAIPDTEFPNVCYCLTPQAQTKASALCVDVNAGSIITEYSFRRFFPCKHKATRI